MSLKLKEIISYGLMDRMFTSSGTGMFIVSPEGRFLDASATFCAKLGYSAEQLLQMNVADLTHPDDVGMTALLFHHFANPNRINVFEKRYIHSNGSTLWFRMRSEAVPALEGSAQDRIVVAEDITRDKLNEIDLELMAAITESSKDAVFRTDLNGIIEFWGRGAERLYGYTADEMLGRHASFIASVARDDTLLSVPERIRRGEVVVDPDAVTKHKDGHSIEISALIFPIRTKDGRRAGIAAVHRDISEFKQLQVELRHSQRLETAGLLAGGIAHDFNNIITVIKGANYLLAEEMSASEKSSAHLQLIERAADRASRLTRQLLAFSRKQKIMPAVFDPNENMREGLSLLTRMLGDDVRLQTEFISTWLVREDVTQFEQVLMNLAVNARHAMPNGGRLHIRTRDLTLPEGHKFASSNFMRYTPAPIQAGQYVMLSVSDTGVGMDRATLEQIFDPFFTTREKGEGAGLGLSVVYGIVTQVGGGISVLTQTGVGSEFQIFLPRTEGTLEHVAPAPATAAVQHRGRILVLEDDATVRMLTSSVLKGAGYTVVEASNPRAVLSGAVDGDVDLILSDVMMPEMSGPEFSEIWLNRHPKARFLFMSGFFDSEMLDRKLTGKTLIQKPFRPSELLQQVSLVLTQD